MRPGYQMVIAYPQGELDCYLLSKIRYLPENRMLSQVCLEMAIRVSLPLVQDCCAYPQDCFACLTHVLNRNFTFYTDLQAGIQKRSK